uniref:Uncharacterized protein n=1 Tax=Triticum urartu TaxID=4572 RepID=A0A8R7V2T4_TRIUA
MGRPCMIQALVFRRLSKGATEKKRNEKKRERSASKRGCEKRSGLLEYLGARTRVEATSAVCKTLSSATSISKRKRENVVHHEGKMHLDPAMGLCQLLTLQDGEL